MHPLQAGIERLYALGPEARNVNGARGVFGDFRESLPRGEIRAAEKENGEWKVNVWVKQGILLGFRLGELMEMGCEDLSFVDKDTFPLRQSRIEDKIRIVPGGSSGREGASGDHSVICMPPMYISAGAYVDEGTLVVSRGVLGSYPLFG